MIKELETVLSKVGETLGYDIPFKVIVSNRPELCDFQCDDAFKLAKIAHKNPLAIGEEIANALKAIPDFSSYFENVEFVKPGFINMTVNDIFINRHLEKMLVEENFGIERPSRTDLYILDYGGPNIAKPLHVGHMRTAIVGESIKRMIRYMGHKTIADVHLGDYGLQIGQVIYGILELGKPISSITLADLEEIYPRISGLCKENEEVKNKCAEITKQLQEGNEEYQKLFKIILQISGDDIKRLYKYLDVSFDLWQGESDSYPYIEKTEAYLKDFIKESEGAKIIEVEEDGNALPPLLFQKSNGAYLYATTDLATIYDRMQKYNPDHILYVVDNRQSLHFKQVFHVCKKSGLTKDTELEFLGYGTVNGTDGKPFKTRSGDAPKLEDLFKEIGELFISKKEENKEMPTEDVDKVVNSILKFADLQNSRERDYIFDIAKFGDVTGKTGPYMLYTYLRIQKILEKESIKKELNDTIYGEVDRNLRLKLLELSSSLETAFKERKPSVLADYIYHIAVLANNFYQSNHIIGLEDKEKKDSWITVLYLTNHILKEMLYLLGIEIPTFM
ncbi:MAG: arginine--tRNA ligase [Bacilli bacterium]|nr:arginine--tRNA ligase [Bacilli bacterium]